MAVEETSITTPDSQMTVKNIQSLIDQLLAGTKAREQEKRALLHAIWDNTKLLAQDRNDILHEAEDAINYYRSALEQAIAQRDQALEELHDIIEAFDAGDPEYIIDMYLSESKEGQDDS